ncbi:MAG TPA: amidohydrolase family protein [Dehalococcoidia bacterium]|nr:amidohydrolase family protein [Dehalococcoidia bacterium]
MIIVDSHVHIALHTYEPVEMLLTQMQYNNVEKTVLVQSSSTTDNTYLIECQRRFPNRLAVVCRVDVDSPTAADDLQYWHDEGAASVRLRNFNRSPGGDPLAIWRQAARLGMAVSTGGKVAGFLTDEFADLVKTLPNLKIVIEHLGGIGFNAVHDAKPAEAQFQKVLDLAHFPNTYIKIHGMGEFCDPPFPYKVIPPYLKMAYDAFGAQRLVWGSDYPPVVMREGYRNSLQFTLEQLPFCSQEELEWVFGKTALSLWNFA